MREGMHMVVGNGAAAWSIPSELRQLLIGLGWSKWSSTSSRAISLFLWTLALFFH
jgi:hypothetical protein